MSRWILRTAILFFSLALLSAAGLLLASVEVGKDGVPVLLSSLALAALAVFAILLAIGTWRKWRKSLRSGPRTDSG
jgi:membrane protein YdbS with pleckstrin-like domain